LGSPHPNITIGKKCTVFPVEFVMRGYITGSTSTSMWTNYAKGVRNYCGHMLLDGLIKNQKLDAIKLTPTTKDDVHDELISAGEVVSSGRMSQQDWDVCASYAHKLFAFGQEKSLEKGLILVDTKYEFGKDDEGNIFLIDEIQTPDSSRYWIADTYEARMAAGEVRSRRILPCCAQTN
jgi:phosphoribosylaminoimidazole-succinocarboxamide synthase